MDNNKLISFSFYKIYFLIIFYGFFEAVTKIIRRKIIKLLEIKYHKQKEYSFIFQICFYLSNIFCIFPYLYIKKNSKNDLRQKQIRKNSNLPNPKLKKIIEKPNIIKDNKLYIIFILFSICYINFFCYVQYLNMSFYIKNFKVFYYYYNEFYFISFFVLFKIFFDFTLYNFYILCLIISIISSLITYFYLSLSKINDNNLLWNFFYFLLTIILRFLLSFIYCCYKYLMVFYFFNGYLIIFLNGCITLIIYIIYILIFHMNEIIFSFEDKTIYLYSFIIFIVYFIQQILLITLIDKLDPFYYALSIFISNLFQTIYHFNSDYFFFKLSIYIINIINGLIYCEIIQINICNLNYYCKNELEKLAKKEEKEFETLYKNI